MQLATLTQTGFVGIGSSRDPASGASAALLMVAAPEQVKTGLRMVSRDDPAWFATIPLTSPDYGKVFVRTDYKGWTSYSFDREGLRFCRGLWNGPTEGVLEVQGRGFVIEGVR